MDTATNINQNLEYSSYPIERNRFTARLMHDPLDTGSPGSCNPERWTPGPDLDQMWMPLFQRSQPFNVTQAYSKQSRQGRPEPLNLFWCLGGEKNLWGYPHNLITIKYLRNSFDFKKTEWSDIHKYSICNLQFSISALPGWVLNSGSAAPNWWIDKAHLPLPTVLLSKFYLNMALITQYLDTFFPNFPLLITPNWT